MTSAYKILPICKIKISNLTTQNPPRCTILIYKIQKFSVGWDTPHFSALILTPLVLGPHVPNWSPYKIIRSRPLYIGLHFSNCYCLPSLTLSSTGVSLQRSVCDFVFAKVKGCAFTYSISLTQYIKP